MHPRHHASWSPSHSCLAGMEYALAGSAEAAHALPINVVLAFDDSYAAHGAAVIASAARYMQAGSARFLCLHDGIPHSRRQQVEASAPGFEFIWREVTDAEMPPMATRGHINRITLFRLGLGKFAPPDWQRVIYLDSDIVVQADLRDLWSVDLNGAPIGAVADVYQDGRKLQVQLGLPDEAEPRYFNAGVLLIDLEMERQSSGLAKSLDVLIARNFDLEFLDQDALNAAFWNRWAPISSAWNVQRYCRQADPVRHGWSPYRQAAIIHFITSDKPWTRSVWHPWAGSYWRALARTPFTDEVIERYKVRWRDLMRIRLRYWISHVL